MYRGIISGYFNPLHYGHLEYMNAAKLHSEFLIAIVNNDFQVTLKGSKKFMDEKHRCQIIDAIRYVDSVILSIDTDPSVCKTIEFIRNKYPNDDLSFFNSGDRQENNLETSEQVLCQKLKIKYVVINLKKVYSSSQLLK